MLTEDDVTRLLNEAGGAYPVPEEGPGYVLEELADVPARRPWLHRRSFQLSAAAAAIVLVALVAPSIRTGTSSSPTSSSFKGALRAAPEAQAPTSARSDALAPQQNSPAGVTSQPAPVVGADDSRVVQTGTVALVVDKGKVTDTVTRLHQAAAEVRGYISDQSSQETGPNPSATLTMRVPVASFDDVIAKIRGLGVKVVSVESSAKDITATYADTQAQIASLTAARQRFLTILSGAKTIAETLTVQQRVDDVQGQIDRLEGQRRVLQSQSDLATLAVSVSEKSPTVLSATEPSGFSKAWHDAKHGFTSGVQGILARSGRALLVLLVAVVVYLVGRFGWRVARRRMV